MCRPLYLVMHNSAADLSVLENFEDIKVNLDIISKSFVTLKSPIKLENSKSIVHVRDTALLSPAGFSSLASLGKLYGDEFEKIDIGDYRKDKMSVLLAENKDLFEKYAIQDSLITLKHANSMEEFYYDQEKLGVPLTLSCVGKQYVNKE